MKTKIATFILLSVVVTGQKQTSGSFGTVTIDGKVWNQITLRPETPIWKLNIAWDLAFYFDSDGNIYDENWNFATFRNGKNTFIDKIYYLSYGRIEDPLYFKIGSLDKVNLGYKILVNDYSNMVQYPQVRNIGLNIRLNNQYVSVQGFVNDFKQNAGVLGARLTMPKLFSTPVGFTFVVDRNQYLGLKDTDEDGYPNFMDHFPSNGHYWLDSDGDGLADNQANEYDRDGDGFPDVYDLEAIHAFWETLGQAVGQDFSNETFYDSLPDPDVTLLPTPLNIADNSDPIAAIAVDFGYPVYAQEKMLVSIYAQAAQMLGNTVHPGNGKKLNLGFGLVPIGIASQFGPATFNIEYRMIPNGQFEFSYWNRTYELERAAIVTTTDKTNIISKESTLGRYGNQKGSFTKLGLKIAPYFKMSVSYQNLIGSNWNAGKGKFLTSQIQSLSTSLDLIKSISRIQYAQLFYQQRNVPHPLKFKRSESTIMGYRAGVELGSGLLLNYTFQKSFRDWDGNGNISGSNETVNLVTIETSFTI